MSKTEIKIGEERHEIETKRIGILIPSAQVSMGPPIEAPRRVPLDSQATVYHAQRVEKLHPDFKRYWRRFMSNTTPPTKVEGEVTADNIRKMGMAAIHLMGLIDMTLKFYDMGITGIFWKYPESFMHPGWQVALGDLVLDLSKENGNG